jgi:hypothetical protein
MQWLTFNRHITSLLSTRYRQPGSLVEAEDASVIDFNTFTTQQSLNAPIAKGGFQRQFNHSALQLPILQPHLRRVVQYSA